jgi:hypothetical protein
MENLVYNRTRLTHPPPKHLVVGCVVDIVRVSVWISGSRHEDTRTVVSVTCRGQSPCPDKHIYPLYKSYETPFPPFLYSKTYCFSINIRSFLSCFSIPPPCPSANPKSIPNQEEKRMDLPLPITLSWSHFPLSLSLIRSLPIHRHSLLVSVSRELWKHNTTHRFYRPTNQETRKKKAQESERKDNNDETTITNH